MYWILQPKQCIKSNWNEFCLSSALMHFQALAATCLFTFECLSQLARLDSDAHFVASRFCPHVKVIRDTRRAAGLFSLSQRPSASKEAVAWGWPFYASPTQLYFQAGRCVSPSPLIAAKLKTTDAALQRHQINQRSMRSHLAGSLASWHQLYSVWCISVCMRLKQREGEKLPGINVIEFWWERLMEQWFH